MIYRQERGDGPAVGDGGHYTDGDWLDAPTFEQFKLAAERAFLQAKLKEFLRTDVTLRFELVESAAPTTSAPVKAASPVRKGSEEFKDDPLIKKALEIFKGQIVDVRK